VSVQYSSQAHDKDQHIPHELQELLFREAIQAAKGDEGRSEKSSHMRYVADCYAIGLGVSKDINKALDWYSSAADSGSHEAAEALLLATTPEEAISRLGLDRYCLYMCYVLTSPLGLLQETESRHDSSSGLETMRMLLCHDPTASKLPLQRAFHRYNLQKKPVEPCNRDQSSDVAVPGWSDAVASIVDDDSEALYRTLSAHPDLPKQSPGTPDLLYVAAELGRAGISRILLDDFGMDPLATRGDGTSPVQRAIELGHVSVARILSSSAQLSRISLRDAAIENASQGSLGTLLKAERMSLTDNC
jgi:hypothetical protein